MPKRQQPHQPRNKKQEGSDKQIVGEQSYPAHVQHIPERETIKVAIVDDKDQSPDEKDDE